MQEQIYLIEWTEQHGEPTSIGLGIEDERDIVASDINWFLVRSHDLGTLERIVDQYPGWSLSGQPADGKFIDIGGDEVEVREGTLVDDLADEPYGWRG